MIIQFNISTVYLLFISLSKHISTQKTVTKIFFLAYSNEYSNKLFLISFDGTQTKFIEVNGCALHGGINEYSRSFFYTNHDLSYLKIIASSAYILSSKWSSVLDGMHNININLANSKLVSTALSDDLATSPSLTASAESTSLPVNNKSAATWKYKCFHSI